ncbi:hypothetical protein M3929_003255 [Vibrio metschnikovii]|uniref:Chain-length determining protein n=1 Tax=bacterium 19PA01SH03 TaxID=2920705 RepID=A0AAU6SNB7_UNCXX|nr:chain-length determining protein [Vibrio sp. V33_P6A3T137]EKO3663927.1 hypothetical protein [Vibrio metschnikovii]EKO3753685.1 hypothetical protein [Vibrio metschnikovii]NAW78558.1 chain-length determining protein [Vibrio sp. V33_P6A3T137]
MKVVFRKHLQWVVCFAVIMLVGIYYAFIATDRYVSQANIVLRSPEVIPTGFSVSSILSGTSGSGDLLLLKDHLESVDMAIKLQEKLDLRQHYSQSSIDRIARLSDVNAPLEKFYRYLHERITIQFDDYAKVLRVRVEAYSPEMAQAIAQTLLEEGERHMNLMGKRLAEEQLKFIEVQVADMAQRVEDAREALLEYQDAHGLVSPTGTVEGIFTIISKLQAQLAVTESQRNALSTFQNPRSPEMQRLTSEIKALKSQITQEQAKLTMEHGNALNRVSAQYQTLEMQAKFALELYSHALIALETTRVEAARKLKQVSVLQYPTLPEFSTEPRRLHNWVVWSLMSVFFFAIVHLARAIIRDHRD